MRKLLVTALGIAALSTAALAQDGDHDDHGPIRAGYAIVTVTDGTSGPFGVTPGGLTVFETFGLRSDVPAEVPALQASVLPATMTTRTVIFADSDIRLFREVGVGITNPGSTDAMVTMTLRRADGTMTATKTIAVDARHQVASFISELFADVPAVPEDIDGTLTFTSDTPVAIVALQFRGRSFSSIPITNLSDPETNSATPVVTPGVGGTNAVLMPQFVAGGRWSTEIIVMNNNSTRPMTVRIDLFNQDGSPLVANLNGQMGSSFQNRVIAPGGIITLSPRNALGDSDF